ncbi:hypothetical protein [Mycobacterium sp. NAZ190054]|uniref:hypothetical protein n=1 Tax=Mycobacterium sp. NAZ190054 TaxID=1747766 RepID=UPI00079B67A7|nr:hypothetical protein [Mycobacterium sp. NAZ190054]KWX66843.1 hypothetical protein ASJ79_05615 [Mycobacterium sp. NAZ190054]
MPNGELYVDRALQRQAEVYAEQYHSVPSFMRDMMGMVEPKAIPAPKPAIFDTRDEAENLCAKLAKQAAAVGVANWGGAVVESLCTPFTSGDPGTEFAAEVAEWVEQHGGAE